MENLTKTIGCFLILLFIFGCSEKSKENSANLAEAAAVGGFNDDYAEGGSGGIGDMLGGLMGGKAPVHEAKRSREENTSKVFTNDNEDRKLIRRANIRIKVEDIDAADIFVTDLMEKHSAYSSSTVFDKSSYRYTIRVPAFTYKAFLTGMDSIGTLLNRSESVEDATVHYYDLEGRLETQKELLKTFQSYLGKAKNIEEILSVEKRIAELQRDLDGTGKNLRNLSNRIDYATIELVILGPTVISSSDPAPVLTVRIKELFSDFGDFLSDLAVVFIGIVIFGIPILLLGLFFYWILLGKVGILKKLWRMVSKNSK